jgi:hypothetical protein
LILPSRRIEISLAHHDFWGEQFYAPLAVLRTGFDVLMLTVDNLICHYR